MTHLVSIITHQFDLYSFDTTHFISKTAPCKINYSGCSQILNYLKTLKVMEVIKEYKFSVKPIFQLVVLCEYLTILTNNSSNVVDIEQ